MNLLAKSFGKGAGFTVGLVTLHFIFYPILAFGTPKYTYGENNDEYSDLSEKTRSWIVICAIIASFVLPVLYVLFTEGSFLGIENFSTYYTISAPFYLIVAAFTFLYGISVNIKYRHIAITLSVCFIVIMNFCYSIFPIFI